MHGQMTRGAGPNGAGSPGDFDFKVFVGGIGWETSEQKLRDYFEKYGQVKDVLLVRDRFTGQPRGFGFITFMSQEGADSCAATKKHEIDGRTVEVKHAVPRDQLQAAEAANAAKEESNADKATKNKVFVGGLLTTTNKEDLVKYFRTYGPVVDANVMIDHRTGNSRGFGFVTFESQAGVDAALGGPGKTVTTEHEIQGKKVEVKLAEPRYRSAAGGSMSNRGGMGGMRGGRGGGMSGAQGGAPAYPYGVPAAPTDPYGNPMMAAQYAQYGASGYPMDQYAAMANYYNQMAAAGSVAADGSNAAMSPEQVAMMNQYMYAMFYQQAAAAAQMQAGGPGGPMMGGPVGPDDNQQSNTQSGSKRGRDNRDDDNSNRKRRTDQENENSGGGGGGGGNRDRRRDDRRGGNGGGRHSNEQQRSPRKHRSYNGDDKPHARSNSNDKE